MIVTPIATDLRVTDTPLGFEQEHRAAIDAYWAKRIRENSRLWNGPFFLFTDVICRDGLLTGQAHRTDFATFLYLRHENRDPSVTHVTGSSLMRAADGAIIAMEMAAHTANAGRIYFPAGSFDPADVVDDRLDPMTNVRRELVEETGFSFSSSAFEDAIAVFDDDTWHVALPNRLPWTFDEVHTRMKAHQAATGDDELARLVPIRTLADTKQMVPFARMLSEHVLTEMS